MASSLARSLGLAKSLRAPCIAPATLKRNFAVSSPAFARRTKSLLEEELTDDDMMALLTEQENITDSPVLGHNMLQAQRQVLHYMRLIEHEMPKLVAYRQPFIPPSDKETPLIMRTLDYMGEEHPATLKRVLVVSVDNLPLANPTAVHKFKLLAGSRWTPNPPKDAGVSSQEVWGNGYFKISCDTFPNGEMNLKWASDTLDKLVAESNKRDDTFSKVPLDLRHVYAKSRKAKKGDHLRNRPLRPVSVADFPKEWLPPTPAQS